MAELLFEQDYCHACRTRFATFFRLRSCNISSLIKHFHPRGRRTAWSSSKSISWLWPERLCAELLVWVLIFCLFDALVAVRSSSDLKVPLNSLLKKYSAGSGILILLCPGNSQRISHLIKHLLAFILALRQVSFIQTSSVWLKLLQYVVTFKQANVYAHPQAYTRAYTFACLNVTTYYNSFSQTEGVWINETSLKAKIKASAWQIIRKTQYSCYDNYFQVFRGFSKKSYPEKARSFTILLA